MAVNMKFRNQAYGHKNPLQYLTPPPIISLRSPTSADAAELGTMWINKAVGAYFILSRSAGGVNTWTAQTAGAGTFPVVTVTGGAGNVLVVNAGGDTNLGGKLDVTGLSTFAGNVVVNGNLTANGDFDISSNQAISFTSLANVAPSILFETNGGTTETIRMYANQGTSLTSLDLLSDAGGIKLTATGRADVAAINLVAAAGGVKIDAVLASAVNVVGAGQDFTVTTTGGSFSAVATESVAGAVNITASGAAGTVALVGAGGVTVTATNNAITVNSGTGAIGLSTDATAATVSLVTGAGVKLLTIGSTNTTSSTIIQSGSGDVIVTSTDAVLIDAAGVLELNSSAGIIGIGNDAVAQNINIGTGAAARTITIGNTSAGTTLALNTPTAINVVAANGLSVTTAGRGVSLPGGILVLAGAGDPNGVVTAPIGSMWLRSNPAGATSRVYCNTNAGTIWTNFTMAA